MMTNANPIQDLEALTPDGIQVLTKVKLNELNYQYEMLVAQCADRSNAMTDEAVVTTLKILKMDLESLRSVRQPQEDEVLWIQVALGYEKATLDLWHFYLSSPGDGGVHDIVRRSYNRTERALNAMFADVCRAYVKRNAAHLAALQVVGRRFFE